MRVLAIAASLLVLAGCGSSGAQTFTAPRAKNCLVHVFFSLTATRDEETTVGAKLRENPRVVGVTFISKAKALAKMKKQYPHLFKKGLPTPPLQDSYVVAPDHITDAPEIAASMRHVPGVVTVTHGLPRFCPQG